jgi:single-strand DNA-binding protein
MSPIRLPKLPLCSPVMGLAATLAGDRNSMVCGPRPRSRHAVVWVGWGPVRWSVSAAASRGVRVPVFGCIVASHRTGLSSPALRVAWRVLSDQGLTAPLVAGVRRLVSHTIRPEQWGREDTMNRWTGTGHLTKDPKFLETENGTAICTLRIAVKRAGKQGHDGYFDVKCFDAQASACAQYLKAGREIAIDGRLLFDEFQTQDGSYASRVYIVAERVEFLASRKAPTGQAEASPDQPAEAGAAREAPRVA